MVMGFVFVEMLVREEIDEDTPSVVVELFLVLLLSRFLDDAW